MDPGQGLRSGERLAQASEFPAHGNAVYAGQYDVEDQEVIRIGVGPAQPIRSVAGPNLMLA